MFLFIKDSEVYSDGENSPVLGETRKAKKGKKAKKVPRKIASSDESGMSEDNDETELPLLKNPELLLGKIDFINKL